MPDSAAGGPEPRARRHIVIHLGLPKTGSTTIQGMLALNAGRLGEGIAVAAKDALTFPVRHTARYSWQGNWHALGGWRYDRALRALVRKIDALDFGTLIISDENLIGLRAGHLFDRQDWRANVGLAARLDRALGHYRRSYVVYTREPGRWRTSSYNQAFKRGETALSFDEWTRTHRHLDGPKRLVDALTGTFGDLLHVVPLDLEAGGNGPIGRRILELAGVMPDRIAALETPPPLNESLPEAAIELLRELHSVPGMRPRTYRKILRTVAANRRLFASKSGDGT